MANIETWFEQDLMKPVRVQNLGNIFNQDSLGNLIGVRVKKNGEDFTLSGSVNGYCIIADGSTVPVIGTRSGNTAFIILPASAYSVTGPIAIAIKLTDGNAITTLAACVGIVTRSRTGVQIDPGQTVTDWTNQIAAALQEVIDTSAAQDVKINDLKSAINQMPKIIGSDEEDVDLDVADDNGKVILRLADGHIQTKNFSSKNVPKTKSSTTDNIDLDIADEQGNVLLRLQNGHIATKKFDSATFGALEPTGDSKDRSAEILAILQSKGTVTLGVGEFYIASSITLPVGTSIRGHGDNTVVIANDSSMTSVFSLTNETTVENLTIIGTISAKPSTMGTMHGVSIRQQNSNNRVLNVNFDGLSGAGVYTIDSYTNNHNSNIISNCRFNHCGCGVYVGRRSEAFVVTGCVVLDSYIGIHCIGGNNRIVSNLVRSCTYGIDMTSASSSDNDGHSMFSSLVIIHNTHAVNINTIEFGSVFNGCTIFYGDISIVNSVGIMFVGCEMGSITSISATGTSAGIRISNCIFNAMDSSDVTGATINDCTKLDGTTF